MFWNLIRSWFKSDDPDDVTKTCDFTRAMYLYQSHVDTLKDEVGIKYGNGFISKAVFDTITQTITDTRRDLEDVRDLTTIELYTLSKKYESVYMPKVLEVSMAAHQVLIRAKAVIDTLMYRKLSSHEDSCSTRR